MLIFCLFREVMRQDWCNMPSEESRHNVMTAINIACVAGRLVKFKSFFPPGLTFEGSIECKWSREKQAIGKGARRMSQEPPAIMCNQPHNIFETSHFRSCLTSTGLMSTPDQS